jgi:hypothetical protein
MMQRARAVDPPPGSCLAQRDRSRPRVKTRWLPPILALGNHQNRFEAISKTVEQDAHASELEHADEVLDVAFPSGHEAPRVVEPGEEALDDPPALIAAEHPPILRRWTDAVMAMRRNELDAEGRPQLGVERVAVVRAVANQARRIGGDEPVVERRGDEPNFMW